MKLTDEEVLIKAQCDGNPLLMTLLRRYQEAEDANLFKMVSAFNTKFGIPVSADGTHQLPYALQRQKIVHMKEELTEYVDAIDEENTEQAFDALIDLVYVALGAAFSHGFKFNEGFKRVHDANMGKTRALTTAESKRGSKFDIVKPAGWKPASLVDLLEPGAR